MSKVIPFKGKKGGKGGGGKKPPEGPKTEKPKSPKTPIEPTPDELLVKDILKGGGRPKALNLQDEKILNQILLFGRLGATQIEMANWFMVARSTIQLAMADSEGVFSQTYAKGLSEGAASLRRLQWEQARKGNYKMQIWLGKQLLQQKDRMQVGSDNDAPLLVKIIDDIPPS